MFWKLLDTDEIQFEIHVKTIGWVGFGISKNRHNAMEGADIVMGWVNNDVAILKVKNSNVLIIHNILNILFILIGYSWDRRD